MSNNNNNEESTRPTDIIPDAKAFSGKDHLREAEYELLLRSDPVLPVPLNSMILRLTHNKGVPLLVK